MSNREFDDKEFDKKEKLYFDKLEYLKQAIEQADSDVIGGIENAIFLNSNFWSDVALTALELGNLQSYFNRFETR